MAIASASGCAEFTVYTLALCKTRLACCAYTVKDKGIKSSEMIKFFIL
jgi:hypothetical protein